jgi:MFS family permease
VGLLWGIAATALCAYAAWQRSFGLLVLGTVLAGYYQANGQLYRFAAAELAAPSVREKAVSLVMAGGLLGAVVGPNLASRTRELASLPFVGAYLALAVVALLAMALLTVLRFPPVPERKAGAYAGRPLSEVMRQPVFIVAAGASALGYGVMNLLMAATPLAMQQCGLPFSDAAFVLEWHVIGMFAPGFFTGHLIRRFGVLNVMGVGVVLNLVCVAIALSGQSLHNFAIALFLLGVGWNFLFTGGTTLSLKAYTPEEKDRAQGAINFLVFSVMALTSLSSGVLVSAPQGWNWLNLGSLLPVGVIGAGIAWLALSKRGRAATA